METNAKHAPGAIRAAEILVRDHWKRVHPRNRPTLIDGLAAMIDRETAAPQLVDALQDLLSWPALAGNVDTRVTKARAALAQATKEANP